MVLLKKRSNPAPLPAIEAVVVHDANGLQFCLKFIPSAKDVHMRGSMFVCMYDNIKSMLPSLQYSDQSFDQPKCSRVRARKSKQIRRAGSSSSGGLGLFYRRFRARFVFRVQASEHGDHVDAFV